MIQDITKPLILAVPKGRIAEEFLPLLEKIGIAPEPKFFDEKDRSLQFKTNHPMLEIIRVRSFDVATLVAYGGAQLGIAGSDVLLEFDYPNLYAPLDLNIGHCRLSVALPTELAASDNPRKWSHIRVATKYPNLTRKHFAARGVQAECIKLSGAIELAPRLGLCRRIVDLVSSGATLTANGLTEVEKILDVSSKLIVNRTAFKVRSAEMKALVEKCEQALSSGL
jgi:ATP phosphoribosyltransferase